MRYKSPFGAHLDNSGRDQHSPALVQTDAAGACA